MIESLRDCRERRASDVQDIVVDGCIVAMEEFSTAELLATVERGERLNADGWLPKMIREYLGCWREGQGCAECRGRGEVEATPGQPGDGPAPCPSCGGTGSEGVRGDPSRIWGVDDSR